MSSELMAAALRRSRYRMEVIGCTADKAGIRSILSKSSERSRLSERSRMDIEPLSM